jgi:RHH-type rel operon transcriptional repressor/antitoxin RelB
VLAIRLEPEIEERLTRLAEQTGRTKTFYAREAILEHLEDLEDVYLAKQSIKKGGRIYTSDEIKSELGL